MFHFAGFVRKFICVYTLIYIRLLEDIQRSQIPTLLPLAFRSAKRPHTCTPRYPFGGFSLVHIYIVPTLLP